MLNRDELELRCAIKPHNFGHAAIYLVQEICASKHLHKKL